MSETIEAAQDLCDRGAIVDEGEITAIDSPALTEPIGGDVVTLEIDLSDSDIDYLEEPSEPLPVAGHE